MVNTLWHSHAIWRHKSGSTLGQVMDCCSVVAWCKTVEILLLTLRRSLCRYYHWAPRRWHAWNLEMSTGIIDIKKFDNQMKVKPEKFQTFIFKKASEENDIEQNISGMMIKQTACGKSFGWVYGWSVVPWSLQWRHNGHDSVSNHQPHDCLLNRLLRRRSKKTSKLRVTGLCAGISPWTGEFPAQMTSCAENVSIWWRHHGKYVSELCIRATRQNGVLRGIVRYWLFCKIVWLFVANGI